MQGEQQAVFNRMRAHPDGREPHADHLHEAGPGMGGHEASSGDNLARLERNSVRFRAFDWRVDQQLVRAAAPTEAGSEMLAPSDVHALTLRASTAAAEFAQAVAQAAAGAEAAEATEAPFAVVAPPSSRGCPAASAPTHVARQLEVGSIGTSKQKGPTLGGLGLSRWSCCCMCVVWRDGPWERSDMAPAPD